MIVSIRFYGKYGGLYYCTYWQVFWWYVFCIVERIDMYITEVMYVLAVLLARTAVCIRFVFDTNHDNIVLTKHKHKT